MLRDEFLDSNWAEQNSCKFYAKRLLNWKMKNFNCCSWKDFTELSNPNWYSLERSFMVWWFFLNHLRITDTKKAGSLIKIDLFFIWRLEIPASFWPQTWHERTEPDHLLVKKEDPIRENNEVQSKMEQILQGKKFFIVRANKNLSNS